MMRTVLAVQITASHSWTGARANSAIMSIAPDEAVVWVMPVRL